MHYIVGIELPILPRMGLDKNVKWSIKPVHGHLNDHNPMHTSIYIHFVKHYTLVGGIPTPLKNMLVSWDVI